ncbi:hypothetical protein SAMN05421801_13919 [Streptococcus equi]|nr:hypothetical protein SAMN05421801_13919 [Streptococcus equi]SIQ93935.1 hypothetical protein SAMN05421817_1382 [Streptococcus equi]
MLIFPLINDTSRKIIHIVLTPKSWTRHISERI